MKPIYIMILVSVIAAIAIISMIVFGVIDVGNFFASESLTTFFRVLFYAD